MNPEKQRIAIAEACGGAFKPCECGHPRCKGTEMRWHWPDDTITNDCPDYPNSLDAMHEAVDAKWKADPYFGMSFAIKLTEVVTGLTYSAQIAAECLEYMITATAAQRAEAFLKTLGLWEEP